MFTLKDTKKGIQKMHVTSWIEMLVTAIEDQIKKEKKGRLHGSLTLTLDESEARKSDDLT